MLGDFLAGTAKVDHSGQRKITPYLAKNGVSRWGGSVEPIQEGIVAHIDEELRTYRINRATKTKSLDMARILPFPQGSTAIPMRRSPPDSGLPVLAILNVPGAFVIRWWSLPASKKTVQPVLENCSVVKAAEPWPCG